MKIRKKVEKFLRRAHLFTAAILRKKAVVMDDAWIQDLTQSLTQGCEALTELIEVVRKYEPGIDKDTKAKADGVSDVEQLMIKAVSRVYLQTHDLKEAIAAVMAFAAVELPDEGVSIQIRDLESMDKRSLAAAVRRGREILKARTQKILSSLPANRRDEWVEARKRRDVGFTKLLLALIAALKKKAVEQDA